jgi:hypothetical protein
MGSASWGNGVEPGEEQVYFVGCGIATRGGQLRQLPAAIAIQIAPTAGSPAIDLEESGVWQRDVSLTVLHTLSDGSEGWAAISWSLTGRLDAGGANEATGPSQFSLGVSVAAARHLFGGVFFYAGLCYARHGQDEWLGLALHRDQFELLGALEWHVWQRTSLVAQFLRSQAVGLAPNPLDLPSNELAWGRARTRARRRARARHAREPGAVRFRAGLRRARRPAAPVLTAGRAGCGPIRNVEDRVDCVC